MLNLISSRLSRMAPSAERGLDCVRDVKRKPCGRDERERCPVCTVEVDAVGAGFRWLWAYSIFGFISYFLASGVRPETSSNVSFCDFSGSSALLSPSLGQGWLMMRERISKTKYNVATFLWLVGSK